MNEQPMHELPAREPFRLLLAGEHPVVRAGPRAVLETEPDFTVVAEASTADEAVKLASELAVDVVLMDLEFADGMRGAQATAQIAQRTNAPRVLVLTTYDTDGEISAVIEAAGA